MFKELKYLDEKKSETSLQENFLQHYDNTTVLNTEELLELKRLKYLVQFFKYFYTSS